MNCPVCGRVIPSEDKFCGGCGASLGGLTGNSVNTGGGNISGGVYQAGRDVVVNHTPKDPPPATYEPEPLWRSPVTQGFLAWAGVLLGIVGLFPVTDFVRSFVGLFSAGSSTSGWWSRILLNLSLIIVVLFVGLLGMRLRRLTKRQLREPLFWSLALNGTGGRITVERIRATCQCGGKMRYRNRDDGRKANILRRIIGPNGTPIVECKRNSSHLCRVESAERLGD